MHSPFDTSSSSLPGQTTRVAPMPLDNKTLRRYRSIGHHLNPVVIVANSLSDNVLAEIDRALSDHELIKVRVVTEDRDSKRAVIDEICKISGAELVQVIGKIALIYRKADQLKAHLSNIQRYSDQVKG